MQQKAKQQQTKSPSKNVYASSDLKQILTKLDGYMGKDIHKSVAG